MSRALGDAFTCPEGEWDYEDTETYITLEVPVQTEDATMSITGIDTPHPLLKINAALLRGTHANLVGSEIIIKDDRPLAVTSQRIVFKPIHEPDELDQPPPPQPPQPESEDETPLAGLKEAEEREELVRKMEKSVRKAARKRRREEESKEAQR